MKKDQEQAKVTSNKSKVNKNTNKRDRDDSDVDEDINKPVSKTRRSNTPVQSTSNSRVSSQHTFEDDLKRTKEGLAKKARQQLGGYARDALSFGFPRSHFILFIVDSKLVRGIFYDRSAIVESGILDLRKNKDRLIFSKMIQQLRGLSPEALGMVPGFNTSFMKDPTTLQYPGPANDKRYPSSGIFEFKEGSSFTFPYGKKGTRTVKVGRVLFRSNGVLGRGPIVMQVTCVCKGSSRCDWCGKKLVLKLSFPSKTRASEKAFMDKCKEKATGEHAWVLNHLPEIYYSFDIEFSAESPQAQLKETFGEEYEMRVVRGIILEELHPLSTLETERECAQVFYDIVQCHHWAWKYPQILHRDISEGNIMVREKNGQKYGVLNDWDLASWLNTPNEVSTSKFRTGTKPYMAHEQHSSKWQGPHRFRHDLESVFYVILLLVSLYSSPAEKVRFPSTGDDRYEKWHKQNDEYLRGKKVDIILNGQWQAFPQPFFSGFTLWLIALQRSLMYGFIGLNVHNATKTDTKQPPKPGRRPRKMPFFDEDTLGENFSYEKVVMIMHQFNQEELRTWGHEWQVTLDDASSEDWESEELAES
ncbi:hypothetical protein F5879DRAFT_907206 [Lentinula edodes]|nr:hypothetical protein F5879DRAFT_907206 [Lentinula edodes]